MAYVEGSPTNYPLTEKYRTPHSIFDRDVAEILELVKNNNVKKFLDFGCHFGHLGFQIALDFPVDVIAVDVFTGTPGDKWMKRTIAEKTKGTGDFFNRWQQNLQHVKNESGGLKGTVTPMRNKDFFSSDDISEFDMIFLDSSHNADDIWEFAEISKKVKKDGIFGGHDFIPEGQPNANDVGYIGVWKGINSIIADYEWIAEKYTYFLRKK